MSEEIKFEKAMERLSKIVEELESGDVSLDDAIKKYEEGVKLSKGCQDQLAKAEKKIEILTKSLGGGFAKQAFEIEEVSETKPGKKIKKPAAASGAEVSADEDKELLF